MYELKKREFYTIFYELGQDDVYASPDLFNDISNRIFNTSVDMLRFGRKSASKYKEQVATLAKVVAELEENYCVYNSQNFNTMEEYISRLEYKEKIQRKNTKQNQP